MSSIAQQHSSTRAYIAFFYSLVCYAASLISLTYFIVFVSGIYEPLSVNIQEGKQPFLLGLLVNIFLISLFGLQHSIMARRRFKTWLCKYVPESVERSTFCLGSSIALAAIPFFWVPMNGQVWSFSGSAAELFIYGIGGTGWILLLVATFQLDHFELFGLRQTFLPIIEKAVTGSEFKTPGLYKIVRHPIQLGLLIGVWAVPVSTANHLVLAIGVTVYILVGLYFEEKDLIREFGNRYRAYKQRVAKLIPFIV